MTDRQRGEMSAIAGSKAWVNTPQFPGQQKGQSIDAVRQFIKNQKRSRGFRFNLVTSNQTFNINISGSARMFLGFAFSFEPDAPATMPPFVNLTINNEVIIQDTSPVFFTQRYMDDEYYFFPRPLSGQDDVILTTQPAGAPIILDTIVYYI